MIINTAETDIAIIGGGIAGLWLLNQLRAAGYSAVLVESGTLGGEQTHKAQGIIHGGMKYALQGEMTSAAMAIADMPSYWRACLSGQTLPDLRQVPVLSEKQYLWTTGSILSKAAGFFAGLALQGNVERVTQDALPAIFQHPDFRGDVYALDEQVIDVHALIRALAQPHQESIFRIQSLAASDIQYDSAGNILEILLQAPPLESVVLRAKKYIFAAGSGNAVLQQNARHAVVQTQHRPLHMVMVKHDFPFSLYGHCLGKSASPRITITTHQATDGKWVWYLGGQLAEEGVQRNTKQQCEVAQQELQKLFPWLNFQNAHFATFRVDRVEAKQTGLLRPDSFSVKAIANYFVVFPTKLAFAPALAASLLQQLSTDKICSGKSDLQALRKFPTPSCAQPMWEQ